jgi:hypothetical protein
MLPPCGHIISGFMLCGFLYAKLRVPGHIIASWQGFCAAGDVSWGGESVSGREALVRGPRKLGSRRVELPRYHLLLVHGDQDELLLHSRDRYRKSHC